jgi:outer membrane protein OmpA-like peptidoglycan-associated protein
MAACTSSPPKKNDLPLDKYQYGSLYMRQMNYAINDKLVLAWEEQLRKDGVSIITVGQEYKLVAPTNLIFYPNSPRIQWESYRVLNHIASYLRCFNKVEVKVAAVTESTGRSERDQALSFNRARSVANYFWGQEIGAGFIYIRGYVVAEQPGRMEISFRSVMM